MFRGVLNESWWKHLTVKMGSALSKLKSICSTIKYNFVPGSSLHFIRLPLWEGNTGLVFQCKLYERVKKDVAVKILHNNFPWSGKRELAALKKLSKLDPDKNNLIRFNRHFRQSCDNEGHCGQNEGHCGHKEGHRGFICLEYELLDKTLYDFMKLQDFKPLCLSEIRVIAQQLLVALNALKSIGLVHVDISPRNVMLVNQLQSFKVKLIGFGAAGPVSTFRHGTTDQCIAYRAPEDLLGLPMNEASDMWALGCTLAFLYLGQHLYPTESEYEVMRAIVQMQGLPDKHMLKDGGRSSTFFTCENYSWRLNDAYEYYLRTGHWVVLSEGIFNKFTSLDDMAKTHSEVTDGAEYEDTQAFLSLIKQMLQVNPEKRITPSEALGHSFVTMKHFQTNKDPYVTSACLAMEACQQEHSLVQRKPFGIFAWLLSRYPIRKYFFLFDELGFYWTRYPLAKGVTGYVVRYKIFQGAKKDVALKVMHYTIPAHDKGELAAIEKLCMLDPDKNNLIRINRRFSCAGRICLEYERLHLTLSHFMKLRDFKPLCLSEIRVITQQLLVALNALKSIGLAHKDIKPQKVMFVNQRQSLRVKLIGFGAARPISKLRYGTTNQCIAYRAPEDLLGLPMNEASDMWALGCTLAFLYLGQHLYPECEYEIMRIIVQMQGVPDKHMVKNGRRSRRLFTYENYSWRLKTEYEYLEDKFTLINYFDGISNEFTSLDDMAKTHSEVTDGAEYEDTLAFLSLIKQMLQVNPEKRITPSEALGHSFVTMKHFHTNKDPYVTSACLAMEACRMESSVECKPFETSRKVISADDSTKENEPPATADIVTAGTKKTGLPDKLASAGFKDPNYAGTDEKASGTDKAASPTSVGHNSHESNTNFHTNKDPYVTSACLAMEACRMEESSVECKPFETSRKVISADDSTKENEPPATADIVTAGTKKTGLPDKLASAGFKDPNYAGTDEKASGTDKAASPTSVGHNSHEGNTSNDKGNTHFVEVKCRKKWLKKIKRFFSRLMKP